MQMTETVSPPSYPAPSGLLFDRMLRSDRIVPFARPLPVEVAVEDGSIILSNEEYDLLVVAPTLTEAIEGWYHELTMLFKVYVDVRSRNAHRERTAISRQTPLSHSVTPP
ncbi:MAG: hypothetical protein ABFC38_08940 [Methanospirillum sp.]